MDNLTVGRVHQRDRFIPLRIQQQQCLDVHALVQPLNGGYRNGYIGAASETLVYVSKVALFKGLSFRVSDPDAMSELILRTQ